jgi:hypothetical protein
MVSALTPGGHVNVTLGKGYGYPGLMQGIVNSQVGLIQGLKI